MNKKSQVIMYGLAAGLLAAIIVSVIDVSQTSGKFETPGTYGLVTLEAAHEAQEVLRFLELSFDHSLVSAVYELAQRGGCSAAQSSLSYAVWDTAACQPASADALLELVVPRFIQFLPQSPLSLPAQPYLYAVRGNYITGEAQKPLVVDLSTLTESEFIEGQYSIMPNVAAEIPSLTSYDVLFAKSQELVDQCRTNDCIKRNAASTFNDGSFAFIEQCESAEQELFLRVQDYIKQCLAATKKGCVCRDKPETTFVIRENKEIQTSTVEARIDGKLFSLEIPSVGIDQQTVSEDQYLHRDLAGELLIVGDIDLSDIACDMEPAPVRLCVEEKNTESYYYDTATKKVSYQNVLYKFSLTPNPQAVEQGTSFEDSAFIFYLECSQHDLTELNAFMQALSEDVGSLGAISAIARGDDQACIDARASSQQLDSFQASLKANNKEQLFIVELALDTEVGISAYQDDTEFSDALFAALTQEQFPGINAVSANNKFADFVDARITFDPTTSKAEFDLYQDNMVAGLDNYLTTVTTQDEELTVS